MDSILPIAPKKKRITKKKKEIPAFKIERGNVLSSQGPDCPDSSSFCPLSSSRLDGSASRGH